MNFVDRTLKCADCGQDFVFTGGEQLFFHDKQFKNDPKRCKQCKGKRTSGTGVRSETRTLCSECKAETTVPFKPTQGRPVLCRHCFQRRRSASGNTTASASAAVAATHEVTGESVSPATLNAPVPSNASATVSA